MTRQELAEDLFHQIEAEFPELSATWPARNSGPIDVSIVFDQQPGLPLAVIAQLEGEQLRLLIGKHFSVEWFPCEEAKVLDEFVTALRGFLGGEVQLIESSKGGGVTKAELQMVATGKSLATWKALVWPSFAKPQVEVFRRSSHPHV